MNLVTDLTQRRKGAEKRKEKTYLIFFVFHCASAPLRRLCASS
jgi:hypothetical protein